MRRNLPETVALMALIGLLCGLIVAEKRRKRARERRLQDHARLVERVHADPAFRARMAGR